MALLCDAGPGPAVERRSARGDRPCTTFERLTFSEADPSSAPWLDGAEPSLIAVSGMRPRDARMRSIRPPLVISSETTRAGHRGRRRRSSAMLIARAVLPIAGRTSNHDHVARLQTHQLLVQVADAG